MKKIFSIFQEQWHNRHLIWKMTLYNMKSQYANHYLGVFWNILQPAMQVLLYYIVFGLGLRGNKGEIDGLPYIVFLISGLFPWLFISQSINSGSSAIQRQLSLVTKMKFPASTLISISILRSVFSLLPTTLIIIALGLIYGYSHPLRYFGFIYFLVASYFIVFGISLIMSSLVIVVRDLKNVLQNVIRMFFFVTPIFWTVTEANPLLQKITSLNPFAYLLQTYRQIFIYEGPLFYGSWHDHLYFWSFTLLMIVVGANVHHRFKDRLIDYL